MVRHINITAPRIKNQTPRRRQKNRIGYPKKPWQTTRVHHHDKVCFIRDREEVIRGGAVRAYTWPYFAAL